MRPSCKSAMPDRPFAEYADRNGGPILQVLKLEFAAATRVLEIGSGTGQHAVRFSAALPHLEWQTSDLDENHAGILAWIKHAALSNVLAPLSFDVATAVVEPQHYDGVYSANTAHIMSFAEVRNMFALVGTALTEGGRFCLYGPFRQDGEFNTPSNAAFHKSLKSRDPEMGIRDLNDLDAEGRAAGLQRDGLYAMPANNHIAVGKKVS